MMYETSGGTGEQSASIGDYAHITGYGGPQYPTQGAVAPGYAASAEPSAPPAEDLGRANLYPQQQQHAREEFYPTQQPYAHEQPYSRENLYPTTQPYARDQLYPNQNLYHPPPSSMSGPPPESGPYARPTQNNPAPSFGQPGFRDTGDWIRPGYVHPGFDAPNHPRSNGGPSSGSGVAGQSNHYNYPAERSTGYGEYPNHQPIQSQQQYYGGYQAPQSQGQRPGPPGPPGLPHPYGDYHAGARQGPPSYGGYMPNQPAAHNHYPADHAGQVVGRHGGQNAPPAESLLPKKPAPYSMSNPRHGVEASGSRNNSKAVRRNGHEVVTGMGGTRIASQKLTADKQQMAKKAFEKFDRDRSGYLNMPEFQKAMSVLGVKMDRADVKAVFAIADTNRNGQLSRQQFTDHFVANY